MSDVFLDLTGGGSLSVPVAHTGDPVTSVEGTILYYDADQGKHVQIAGDSGLGGTEELVTNGDFSDGGTSWQANGNAVISIGQVDFNGSNIQQFIHFEVDKRYSVTTNITEANTSPTSILLYGDTKYGKSTYLDGVNINILTVDTDGGSATDVFKITGVSNAIGYSLSVKQILDLSTVHTFKDQTIGNFISFPKDRYFTTQDIAYLDSDKEMLNRWANGETTPLSITKRPTDLYYKIIDGADNVGGLPITPPYNYVVPPVPIPPVIKGGAFAERAKRLAHRLIYKYGDSTDLVLVQEFTYDPFSGETSKGEKVTHIKGVVSNYNASKGIEDNVSKDDLLMIVAYNEVLVNVQAYIDYDSKRWTIINAQRVTTQDELIIQKLQVRVLS